ncbi:hypothetical protein HDU97_006018 [Phlyctochytrium planicorne]|nr:hypothetical protein HDU97_006018 [Phlyctochytrium planicorne]
MVKWISNLPDSDHVPFKLIAEEPHIKTVVKYFRAEDYLAWAAIAAGFPAAQVAFVRFWGWRENGREAARWEAEAASRPEPSKNPLWEENDW